MGQTIIYDFLKSERDPLLQKLEELERCQSVVIKGIEISLNRVGLYEVSTNDTHDCFSDLKKCYDFICEFLENVLNGVKN